MRERNYTGRLGHADVRGRPAVASFVIPILDNSGTTAPHASLTLASPGGGATLGLRTRAELTITDDDGSDAESHRDLPRG